MQEIAHRKSDRTRCSNNLLVFVRILSVDMTDKTNEANRREQVLLDVASMNLLQPPPTVDSASRTRSNAIAPIVAYSACGCVMEKMTAAMAVTNAIAAINEIQAVQFMALH